MTRTDKSRKKENKTQRALVIKQMAAAYNVSDSYIRQCLLGYWNTEKSDEISKEYNRLMAAIDNVFKA